MLFDARRGASNLRGVPLAVDLTARAKSRNFWFFEPARRVEEIHTYTRVLIVTIASELVPRAAFVLIVRAVGHTPVRFLHRAHRSSRARRAVAHVAVVQL